MQPNELAVALGDGNERKITADGRVVVIVAMRLGTLAAVFPVLEKLATAGVVVADDGSCPDIAAFLRGGPEAVTFLALASGLPADDVANLTLTGAEVLLQAVWETNADFFRRSAAAMAALDTRIWSHITKALGSPPSKT